MSIALPTLVVFLFLLPGFIARSQIKRAERLSLDYSPFGQVVTEAVLWATFLHVVCILAAAAFTTYEFRPDVALKLLGSDTGAQGKALEAVAHQAGPITGYFVSVLVLAYLGPTVLRQIVIRLRLDRSGAPLSSLVRFSGAPWYYLLSGADFEKDLEPDLVAISAIVDIANTAYLYTGILDDYFVDPDGKLDRLILQQVMRRPLLRDKTGGGEDLERFYAIDGDYFVLRYSEIATLNVEYIKLRREDEADDAVA